MMRENAQARVEVTAGIGTMLIGAFFVLVSWGIDPLADDAVGPRFVPLFVSCGMVILGLVHVIGSLRQPHTKSTTMGFSDSVPSRVASVLAVGVIYLILFALTGYFLATLIVFPAMLFAFGYRQIRPMLWLPVLAAVIYQFVFMGLMGLHDPAGSLIDASSITQLISGD